MTNITITIPDELLSRAQILADTEGVTLEAYINRCVDDAVTHAEAAEAEMDAADEAPQPVRGRRNVYLDMVERAGADGIPVQVVFMPETQNEPKPVQVYITPETQNEPKPARSPVRATAYQSKSQVQREIRQARQDKE